MVNYLLDFPLNVHDDIKPSELFKLNIGSQLIASNNLCLLISIRLGLFSGA